MGLEERGAGVGDNEGHCTYHAFFFPPPPPFPFFLSSSPLLAKFWLGKRPSTEKLSYTHEHTNNTHTSYHKAFSNVCIHRTIRTTEVGIKPPGCLECPALGNALISL